MEKPPAPKLEKWNLTLQPIFLAGYAPKEPVIENEIPLLSDDRVAGEGTTPGSSLKSTAHGAQIPAALLARERSALGARFATRRYS